MPDDIVIRVENLGKRYVLGRETRRAATFAGRVCQTVASPFSWLTSQMRGPSEDEILWALKDVSFEVKRGEVLGVIGRNGAGKSTLLKILSRITEPTTGHAEIHGRIAALLEVGTGMHPELTGRENIYLNGTILGMRKFEIDSKFDEIVDFSGIERFIDTPVKRYSSGMRVRLGFAIAAHLEPEILVIDEVLAVGDAEFQKKCLGKTKDVAGHGRTVLFVSHNMAAISTLCSRAILLHDGRKINDDETSNVVLGYHECLRDDAGAASARKGRGEWRGDCRFVSAVVVDESGKQRQSLSIDEGFSAVMLYEVLTESEERRVPNFHFVSADGSYIFTSNAPNLTHCSAGRYRAECRVPGHLLNEGVVSIGFAVTSYADGHHVVEFLERNALCVNLVDPKVMNECNYGYVGTIPGVIRPRLDWKVEKVDS